MRNFFRLSLALVFVTASQVAGAQGIPIPFASTYAGLAAGSASTTVCSTGLATYLPTGTGPSYGDGCMPTQASLSAPVGVAIDRLGNLFIADQSHNLVRVVYNGGAALSAAIIAANPHLSGLTPTKGNIYTVVGGPQSSPSISSPPYYCSESTTTAGAAGTDRQLDGCPGAQAYDQPRGFGVDADGNLFIGNVGSASNVRVFYVGGAAAAKLITLENPTITAPQPGYVYNIAGIASTNYSGDGGIASKAGVNTPRGMAVDANENIYFADQANAVIRRIDGTTGIITTVAGHCVGTTSCTATASSGDGAVATDASVNIYQPYAVVFDAQGNMFIAEGGSTTVPGRVRVVYAAGTLPGITNPTVGNVYTYAGGANASGTQAQRATFQFIYGVSIDPSGFLYATEYRSGSALGNHVYRIDPSNGNMIIFAGTGGSALTNASHCERNKQVGLVSSDNYGDNCPSTQSYLNTPQGPLVFDSFGNSYLADRTNNVVRKFAYNNIFPPTPVGTSSAPQVQAFFFPTLTTLLTKTTALQGQSTSEFSVAAGTDTCPTGAIIPTSANTCTNYVQFTPAAAGLRVGSYINTDATGPIATETVAGTGVAPVLALDPSLMTSLGSGLAPTGVSTDLSGNVYVSDANGKQILRASLASPTGTAVVTSLGKPQQSATDSFGNLYFADSANNSIVELRSTGGTLTLPIEGLSAPQGVAADRYGNLVVADTGNNRLLYFSPLDGAVTTIPAAPLSLNAPTQLLLDSNANLFVIDSGNKRLIEYSPNALPTVVALPAGTVPTAVGEDASGTLYIGDTTTGSVFTLFPGATVGTPLVTNLTNPVSLALDAAGNLFVADTALKAASGYNRSSGAAVFGTTNVGLKSLPITFSLMNVGNASATLSSPPFVEIGANASAFVAGTPSTCAASLVLTAGVTCTQTFAFQPTSTTSPQTAQVIFSTTSGQSVSSNFSAAATNLILTQLNVTGPSGQLRYGQAATYSVTLVPQSTGASAPQGSVTFSVDGHTVTTTPVSANPYTFTSQLGVGTHAVAFTYSGDSTYASSNASTSITVLQAVTTTTVSATQNAAGTLLTATVTSATSGPIAPTGNVRFLVDGQTIATVPVGNGTVSTSNVLSDGTHTYQAIYDGDVNYAASNSTTQSISVARAATTLALTITSSSQNGIPGLLLTATVSGGSASGKPSGTVTFSNNGTTLASVSLPANGVATYFTQSTKYTFYSFTATYSGDGLFQPSSATATEGPDFAVVSPVTALTVVNGAQATLGMTVVPINGYAGQLSATCAGLPVNSICRFTPVPFSLTATANATLTVQVFAGIDPTLAGDKFPLVAALLALIGTLTFARRRSTMAALALIALVALPFSVTGCSGVVPGTTPTGTFSTPPSTSIITVNVTDSSGLTHTANFTLNVISR